MAKRKATSKKLRFEVFKRDSFSCQYCGRNPPAVVLEVDHIIPVCEDGETIEENLITACFDCNRGKAGNSLSSVPKSIEERTKLMAEKEGQIKAYKQLLTNIKRRENKIIRSVGAIYTDRFEDYEMTESFKSTIRTQFIPKLMPDQIENAMHIACSKMWDEGRALKYFCGVCWKMIKEGG